MSKAFNKIMAGAQDALAYSKGDTAGRVVRTVRVVEAKDVRKKTKLSQAKFARTFHIPIGTLRNWEQGIRKPDGPSIALLTIIDHDPEFAKEALNP